MGGVAGLTFILLISYTRSTSSLRSMAQGRRQPIHEIAGRGWGSLHRDLQTITRVHVEYSAVWQFLQIEARSGTPTDGIHWIRRRLGLC